MSRTKLTEVDKFFIEGHQDRGITALAETLGVTVSAVKKFMTTIEQSLDEEPPKPKPAPNSHMITTTANGRGGVAIMTEAASMHSDDAPKKGSKGKKDNVHTIR